MTDTTKQTIESADKALRSRMGGEKWVRDNGIPTLCGLSKTIKIVDAERKTTIAPLKEEQAKVERPFKEKLTILKDRDTTLRARLMDEYSSAEGITIPGAGGISFTENWVFEIEDPSKVDKEYCDAVNEDKIVEAIMDGVRNIKGVRIYTDRTLRVTPEKATA